MGRTLALHLIEKGSFMGFCGTWCSLCSERITLSRQRWKQGDLPEAFLVVEARDDESSDKEHSERWLNDSGHTSKIDRIYKWVSCREEEKSRAQGRLQE